MAGQNIDAVFAAIINDCQTIAVEAVKNAANKAQTDILQEAKSYLQKYYSNYIPKYYKRTYHLQNAITPVFEDRSTSKTISIEVGVEYDSSKLKGHYKSNSRFHQSGDVWKIVTDHSHVTGDNGIPEPEWIMGNFLEGIHPWGQTDTESTQSLMEDFFNAQLPSRINQYVQESLFGSITSRL